MCTYMCMIYDNKLGSRDYYSYYQAPTRGYKAEGSEMCSVGLQVETWRVGCSGSVQQVQQARADSMRWSFPPVPRDLASCQFRPSATE